MPGALLMAGLVAALVTQLNPHHADSVPQLTRVKPADAEMRRLVLDGYSRSSTFRTLVDHLQQMNVIVVVQFGSCANGRIRSCVSDVQSDARQRYIRIKVDTRALGDRLVATIAHELHHALEIASDLEVTNAEQVLTLYRRIAYGPCGKGLSDECETEAALKVEMRVNEELGERAKEQSKRGGVALDAITANSARDAEAHRTSQ